MEKPSLFRGGGLRQFLSPVFSPVLTFFPQETRVWSHPRRTNNKPLMCTPPPLQQMRNIGRSFRIVDNAEVLHPASIHCFLEVSGKYYTTSTTLQLSNFLIFLTVATRKERSTWTQGACTYLNSTNWPLHSAIIWGRG